MIAAVNGVALGGGTELVGVACDLAVACDWAEFGLPEVRRGRFAGQGGLFRLPAQVPWKLAMEMIFTGVPIRAETALALGLVNRLAASVDEMMELAMDLAGKIASERAPCRPGQQEAGLRGPDRRPGAGVTVVPYGGGARPVERDRRLAGRRGCVRRASVPGLEGSLRCLWAKWPHRRRSGYRRELQAAWGCPRGAA